MKKRTLRSAVARFATIPSWIYLGYKRLCSSTMQEIMDYAKRAWRQKFRSTRRRSSRLRDKPRVNYSCLGEWLWPSYQPQVSKAGTLNLYLNPPPKECPEGLPLEGLRCLNLRKYNYLPALVSGRRCVMFVDSGCTAPFMSSRMADSLGLRNAITKEASETVGFWDGDQHIRLGRLRNVSVKLSHDLELKVDFFVVEDSGLFFSDDAILDNSTLRRYGVIQTFENGESKLYFRDTVGHKSRSYNKEYFLQAHLTGDLRDMPMEVGVDTGASSFYISGDCREDIVERSGCRALRRVNVRSQEGTILLNCKLHGVPNDDSKFVIGSKVMNKYKCAIDYKKNKFYFVHNDQILQTNMYN